MTTLETFGMTYKEIEARRAEAGLVPALRRVLSCTVRDFREHRATVRISRLDPHLIRDMGFDPEAIYAALQGTWDGIDIALLRRR